MKARNNRGWSQSYSLSADSEHRHGRLLQIASPSISHKLSGAAKWRAILMKNGWDALEFAAEAMAAARQIREQCKKTRGQEKNQSCITQHPLQTANTSPLSVV